jgi:hypothetical protein
VGKFDKWLMADAKWYQFWMPGSGVGGGMSAALVVIIFLILVRIWG